MKFHGGILLCVVKVQRIEEVGKSSANKLLPGFAQARQMGVSKPLGRDRGGIPNDCFSRSGLFSFLTISALRILRRVVSYRRGLEYSSYT